MKCKMCGNDVHDGDKFCKHCGQSVSNDTTGKYHRCENCGALMDPEDVYCLNCGERRDLVQKKNTISSYRKTEEQPVPSHKSAPENKGTGKYIALGVFGIAALILLFVGWNYYSYHSKLDQADRLFNGGEYALAQDAYQQLADKDAKPEVLRKLKESKAYSQAQSNYDNALNSIQKGQYQQALELLAAIPEEAKEIKTLANEEIGKMETAVLEFAKSSIEDMDYSSAEKVLTAYAAQDPNNEEIKKAKEDLSAAKNKSQTAASGKENTNQALSSSQTDQSRKTAEQKAAASQARGVQDAAYSQAYLNGLIGLNTTVTSAKANLRSAPDINASVITYVSRGAEVYIYDIVPDGTERIWCRAVVTSIVTGNTYDAWISSRNLDYSL
ncbi:MAG: SH3 domain-containing protein [Gallicola sp.]|uniref:double zinc ribbon domain-containing protein n=1 Tax=Gallicola sp. Sow4_E12 TaxID=3438785 RepID=UPI0017E74C3D|nr:SH3 domain-containing protein [Gallicola sp.]